MIPAFGDMIPIGGSSNAALTTLVPVLTAQAYNSQQSDLGKLLAVAAGVSEATVTLVSPAAAGDGAIQVVTKSDDDAQSVTGTSDNGSGLVRLAVPSTAGMVTNQWKTINQVNGCAEANGTWRITVVDSTHLDLQGSAFLNAYVSGGKISGGRVIVSYGATALAWLHAQGDIVALRSDGTNWTAIGWNIKPVREYFRAVGATTWTKAPLASNVDIYGVGPGASGGSGARRATGGIRTGGAGGQSGQAVVIRNMPASRLGATEVVTNVAGGAPAAAVTVDTTNGNPGVVPANATFGAWLTAIAGGGTISGDGPVTPSAGGSNANAAAGTSANVRSNWAFPQTPQGSISTANAAQVLGSAGSGPGAAGGSADAANVQRLPSAGALGSIASPILTAAGTAGTAGNPGGPGGDVTDFDNQIAGGGGGGGFFVAATAGTAGGRGGNPGGGGGGGAAADNGNNSGASGKGGDSAFLIVQNF